VIKAESDDDAFYDIEKLRSGLLMNNQVIEVVDFGSGSSSNRGSVRRINSIARTSLTPKKFAQLYRRIIDYFQFQNIIELGTSLGINTLYLASRSGTRVHTFEGAETIAQTAQKVFNSAGATNIKLINGDINHTLPEFLRTAKEIDFAFMDANHRYQATLNYFNEIIRQVHRHSVVVLDDIHHSGEMERAWNEIRQHPSVFGTADLFRCGLVFFDPSVNRQHHVLRF